MTYHKMIRPIPMIVSKGKVKCPKCGKNLGLSKLCNKWVCRDCNAIYEDEKVRKDIYSFGGQA